MNIWNGGYRDEGNARVQFFFRKCHNVEIAVNGGCAPYGHCLVIVMPFTGTDARFDSLRTRHRLLRCAIVDDAAHEIAALVDRFAVALNDRDREGLSACVDLPLMGMRAPLGDETDMGEAVLAITDPAVVLNLLPEHWGHSTVDSHVTLESVAAFPDRLADWEYRPAVITTWTRWDRNGRPYERVQALYLMTRRGGRLLIKFAAELAVAKLD